MATQPVDEFGGLEFLTGTHEPIHLTQAGVPLFVSDTCLRHRATLPRAIAPVAYDSGGFTQLQIHHGALLTCVWRPETAACQDTNNDGHAGPAWSRCRLTCTNIAYTDRDIAEVRRHVTGLRADVADPAIPQPLRHRIQQRLHEHERVLAAHHATRRQADTKPAPGSCT